MASVREELEELTGITQNRREGDDAFAERIVKALDDVPDKKYNKLSKAAQGWAEEATQAYNDKEDYPAFPEAEDEDEPEDTEEAEPETEDADEDEGEPEDDGEPATDEPEDDDMPATHTDDDEAPRQRKRAGSPAKKTAVKSSKSDGDGKSKTSAKIGGKAAKAGGALTYVRELLVKNPDITVADLTEKVKAKGHAVSTQTLHTTRSGFRQDIRVLQDAGLLKRKLV